MMLGEPHPGFGSNSHRFDRAQDRSGRTTSATPGWRRIAFPRLAFRPKVLRWLSLIDRGLRARANDSRFL